MSLTCRFRATWPFGALALACDLPVDASKYEVDDANFDRIVEAFADGNQDCKACVSRCVSPINQCAETEGCTEFAECVRTEANPAGQASCASEMVDVPFQVTLAYADMVYCWMACGSRCAVGTNWDCLDGYNMTQAPLEQVKIRQTFKYCEGDAVQNARVEYCGNEEHCTSKTITDESGTYSVEIPILEDGPLAGWRGHRRVVGAQLAAPHRLERNLPIWSNQVELTMLLSEQCADNGATKLNATYDAADWRLAIAVQVFDCHISGAEGVVLEVPTAPNAEVVYATSDGASGVLYLPGQSSVTGQGSALVANLPDGEHKIVAREARSGAFVGEATVTMPTGDVILYSVLPEARE